MAAVRFMYADNLAHGPAPKLRLDSRLVLVSMMCLPLRKEKAPSYLLMKTNDSALHLFLAGLCFSLLDNTELQYASSICFVCCDFILMWHGKFTVSQWKTIQSVIKDKKLNNCPLTFVFHLIMTHIWHTCVCMCVCVFLCVCVCVCVCVLQFMLFICLICFSLGI